MRVSLLRRRLTPEVGTLNDCVGKALRAPSCWDTDGSLKLPDGWALRLRERLEPSLFSSGPNELAGAMDTLSIGVYDRGIEGENDETCSKIANSSVEFVNLTILLRRVDDTACGRPWVLMILESWTTV